MTQFNIRALNGGDLFVLANIVQKLDLVDEVVNKYNRETDKGAEKAIREIESKKKVTSIGQRDEALDALINDVKKNAEENKSGAEFMGILVSKLLMNLPKVKVELNQFLGDVASVDPNTLSLIDYTKLVKEVFTSKDFMDFFKFIPTLLADAK